MRIHDETSAAQFERIAHDAMQAVRDARAAVEAAKQPPPKPKRSISPGRLSTMFRKEPEPASAPANPYNPFEVIAGQMRTIPGADVDQSSSPAGQGRLPDGPVFDGRTEGNRDTDSIVGPAIEANKLTRRERIEAAIERERPERERIQQVREDMEKQANDYWKR